MSGNGTWNTTILMVYNEMCNEISFDVFIIKLYTTLFDGVYKFIYFANWNEYWKIYWVKVKFFADFSVDDV